MDELLKRLGFVDVDEFNRLVSCADLSAPEKIAAFKKWQLEDGSKEGLLKLQRTTPLPPFFFILSDDSPIWETFD